MKENPEKKKEINNKYYNSLKKLYSKKQSNELLPIELLPFCPYGGGDNRILLYSNFHEERADSESAFLLF